MNKTQRNEQTLLDHLKTRKAIDLRTAMELLGVSESTARRLFLNLEQSGLCVRGHGCLRLLDNDLVSIYTYETADNQGVAQKELIAQKAVQLIENGDVIYLDNGTTLARFSSCIADALRSGALRDLTVFTNSLINLNILKDCAKVHVIGGEYRDNRKDFCGMIAENAIRSVCYSKCFIGTDGYSRASGFTATDFQTARLAQAAIANSAQRYILADSEKFRKTAMVCFAADRDISAIVTDQPDELAFLSEKDIAII